MRTEILRIIWRALNFMSGSYLHSKNIINVSCCSNSLCDVEIESPPNNSKNFCAHIFD
jgi:hypothetical protein